MILGEVLFVVFAWRWQSRRLSCGEEATLPNDSLQDSQVWLILQKAKIIVLVRPQFRPLRPKIGPHCPTFSAPRGRTFPGDRGIHPVRWFDRMRVPPRLNCQIPDFYL